MKSEKLVVDTDTIVWYDSRQLEEIESMRARGTVANRAWGGHRGQVAAVGYYYYYYATCAGRPTPGRSRLG
ncbi:MAG TPA: hypothetical protein VLC95_13810 [Anaerolineae bacterium]|nr:hypothetical protein [Anaerolineae bacterium]